MVQCNKKSFVYSLIIFLIISLKAHDNNTDKFERLTPLAYSRGPGPLFAFGQGIQPQGIFAARTLPQWVESDLHTHLVIHNHYYYGITDRITLGLKLPIIAKKFSNGVNGRGIGDLMLETEVVMLQFEDTDFRFRTTALARVIFPTTTSKIPATLALHSTGGLLGMTQSNTTATIYQYMELGILIPSTDKHGFNFGTTFYYNFGIGYAFINTPDRYFGLDYEISGEYQKSHKDYGVSDFTTGGNRIYFGPAFRMTTKRIILQGGIQFPYVKVLRSPETSPENYRAAISFAVLF